MYFVVTFAELQTTSVIFIAYSLRASTKQFQLYGPQLPQKHMSRYLADFKSRSANKYVLNVLSFRVLNTLRTERLFYLEYSHTKKCAFDHLSYICALPAVVHKSQVKRKSHGFIKQPINRHFRL